MQNKVHEQISSVVSHCLRTVFGDESYEFAIRFDQKRGKTEAVLILSRDGLILDDPLEQAGLGVVDVAAFALRLSCILAALPQKRKLVVLDEPFRHLAIDLRPIAANLLLELARATKTQFILVTHFSEIETGTVIVIRK